MSVLVGNPPSWQKLNSLHSVNFWLRGCVNPASRRHSASHLHPVFVEVERKNGFNPRVPSPLPTPSPSQSRVRLQWPCAFGLADSWLFPYFPAQLPRILPRRPFLSSSVSQVSPLAIFLLAPALPPSPRSPSSSDRDRCCCGLRGRRSSFIHSSSFSFRPLNNKWPSLAAMRCLMGAMHNSR